MIQKSAARATVRIISFSLAIVLVLSCFTIGGYRLAETYRANLEYTYLRALSDLSNYISNIETTLTKGVYANTAPLQYGISAKLLSESNGAKSALAGLPLGSVNMENVNKFIAQVGDFASYLSSNLAKGKTMTEDEMKNLQTMGQYAKKINTDLKDITARFDDGTIHIGDAPDAVKNVSFQTQNESEPYINTGFHEMNEGFTDYPTMLYDGPFSDHITRMKPQFLENKAPVTLDDAKQKAANFLGADPSSLTYTGDSSGNLPLYHFTKDAAAISVTKNGGQIDDLLNSRGIGPQTIDSARAFSIASAFLASHGMNTMKESYYVTANGICTINYAYQENGVVYYPDLVKVGVALDTGEIVSYQATGFLMNHHARPAATDLIPAEKAKESVSSFLTIEKEALCCIPTAGLHEVLCYEFTCTGQNNDHVLVYINAETGLEEQILILVQSDGGMLVM